MSGGLLDAVLLDDVMPSYDATRIEHRVIDAPPERVYEAALHADFMQAFRESRAARALVTIRSAAERSVSALSRRTEPPARAPAGPMTLAGLPTFGEYVLLGIDPPREIAFGMVGRFWGGETRWEEIAASEFRAFDAPGLARIACNFSLRHYGEARTLITYETRTDATEPTPGAPSCATGPWPRPFVGIVLRRPTGRRGARGGGPRRTELTLTAYVAANVSRATSSERRNGPSSSAITFSSAGQGRSVVASDSMRPSSMRAVR